MQNNERNTVSNETEKSAVKFKRFYAGESRRSGGGPKIRRPMNVSQFIALVFIGIILTGTVLLSLPAASRDGTPAGFVESLFTATSATCVTGLVLSDTWTQWSGFGQTVIAMLIEIGGLGFVSIASFVIYAVKKKLNVNEQMLVAQSIGTDDITDSLRVQRKVIAYCLSVEAAGAVLLTLRFWPEYGFLSALKLGAFHSVSAFCNAGFDIMGFEAPGGSLTKYGSDPAVCGILSLLIVIGGLGFLVWDDILRNPRPRKWSVYTKLVVVTNLVLIFGGAVLFFILEYGNPGTIGEMSVFRKVTASFFQSVTTRTAGFAGVDQASLTEAGKAVTIVLMFIGGSSGSTAGGLKTVTFAVLILFLWSRVTGRKAVRAFKRTVQDSHVLNALTVFGLMILLSVAGGSVISATSPVSLTDGLFESVSALATVGLSTGATPALSTVAKFMIIVLMYFGRVGLLTICIGFLQEKRSVNKIKYAETSLLIG